MTAPSHGGFKSFSAVLSRVAPTATLGNPVMIRRPMIRLLPVHRLFLPMIFRDPKLRSRESSRTKAHIFGKTDRRYNVLEVQDSDELQI
jgi:hypothetical protein